MIRLPESLDLFVEGHVSADDAARQAGSAQAILQRLAAQPGLILGDEVGMGKTFVALAVAAAHVVRGSPSPVVVMVPQQVVTKWQRDAETFREKCLRSAAERERFRVGVADSGVGFLKLLDDRDGDGATVIILAHGALHRKLADKWVKLAVLQAAVRRRANAAALRARIAKYGGRLVATNDKERKVLGKLLKELLELPPKGWKPLLVQHKLLGPDADDPVPQHFVDALETIDLGFVHERIVDHLPIRDSAYLDQRLKEARAQLDGDGGVLAEVWKTAVQRMNVTMPLLVLDEAHRARHGSTRLAKLLREESEQDLDRAGQLAGRFHRMLFLTATPFQLGHAELLRVLSRFRAIRWDGAQAPSTTRLAFDETLEALRASLDSMQMATERLEKAWKRLVPADLDDAREHGDEWWKRSELASAHGGALANDRLRGVVVAYGQAKERIHVAETALRPWVLRSSRSPFLPVPFEKVRRRRRIEGAAVAVSADQPAAAGGLKIAGAGALPFLLAARLATVAEKPRIFSEGIASSFEALLDTSREEDAGDLPDGTNEAADEGRAAWYLEKLRAAAGQQAHKGYEAHPKLKATIDRAMDLWRRGEKVLVFCHYRQSGSALHRYLSEAMLDFVETEACAKLKIGPDELPAQLARITSRLDRGERAARRTAEIVRAILATHPELAKPEFEEPILDVILRFLRTPTFLVRFGGFDHPDAAPEAWVDRLFASTDEAGNSLRRTMESFASFLARRSTDTDRHRYLDALKKVQTGTHAGPETATSYDDDELQEGEKTRLAANVRRVYGKTRQETRERITQTFNTPFYPEILITSNVMAEGVDLHLNCRHVLHHDLDWNPSSLEQRTGRIDRLGSRAERTGQEIQVYLPYVEGCGDEKLFRVVMDRERWFGVVMGAEQALGRVLKASPWEIERMAEQPQVPPALVESLHIRLAAADRG